MKMIIKCHKIKGIEKEVCSAEQVIAYNQAQHYADIGRKIENSDAPEFIKGNSFYDIKTWIIQDFDTVYPHSRYNIDAVIIAFEQGFRQFCKKPFIATNYDEIGKAFPIPYEIK